MGTSRICTTSATAAAADAGKIETKTRNHHNDEAFCVLCCDAVVDLSAPTKREEPATFSTSSPFQRPLHSFTMVHIAFLFAFLCNCQRLHFFQYSVVIGFSCILAIRICSSSCLYSETFSLQMGTNQFILFLFFFFRPSCYFELFHSQEMARNTCLSFANIAENAWLSCITKYQ